MQYKVLSLDPDNGANTMTIQYDGGYKQPPSVSYSEMELLIMEGSMKIGNKRYGPGMYFFVPKGVSMPAFYTKEGCLALLMYNDSEPHIEESDEDVDGADRDGLIQVASYDDIPWAGAPPVSRRRARMHDQDPALGSTDPGAVVSVLHGARVPPGQHLLP